MPALSTHHHLAASSSLSDSGISDTSSDVLSPPSGSKGDKVIDYQLVGLLSAGPDGIAYRATTSRGRPIEVRRLIGRADEESRVALEQRLSLTKLIQHPAIQQVIEWSTDGAAPTVVMAPASQTTLASAMPRIQAFPIIKRLELAESIASAVAELHQIGLPHSSLNLDRITTEFDSVPFIDPTGINVSAIIEPTVFPVPAITAADDPIEYDIRCLSAIVCLLIRGEIGQDGLADQTLINEEKSTSSDSIWQRMHTTGFGDGCLADTAREIAQLIEAALADFRNSDDIPRDLTAEIQVGRPLAFGSFPSPIAVEQFTVGSRIGRYELLAKLGEGGMGAVYKAKDLSDDSFVALKLIRGSQAGKSSIVRRFLKEARLLAAIDNPYVTRFREVNEQDGTAYLTMDFVSGVSLKQAIVGGAVINEERALRVIGDVCRALVDAHARGIVHRDVKPDNILLGTDGEIDSSNYADLLDRAQVKLTDFGIAREVDQSASMEMTVTGAILGTPIYMAPEQCHRNEKVSSATDVYAIGITLFELLAGRPPFVSDEAIKLVSMHCFEAPPKVRQFCPTVSDAVEAIVEKALQKKGELRYADASTMLRDIERAIRGDASSIDIHPIMPKTNLAKVFSVDFQWDLKAAPEQLWPFVSDTNALNRAVGLMPIDYRHEQSEDGRLRTFGSFRLAGMTIGWEEHPFEWVEGRRLGVFREFHQGPFRWFLTTTELEPLPQGGTRLFHRVRIEPRNFLGRLVAAMEVGLKAKRSLEKVYRGIDRFAFNRQRDWGTDAFGEHPRLSRQQRFLLNERFQRMATNQLDSLTLKELRHLLEDGSGQQLGRIRPMVWAGRWERDPEQVLDACLAGVQEGVLTMGWDVICPTCRISTSVKESLRAIKEHQNCEACGIDFEVDFARSVELFFRAHPEIRNADTGLYCAGGPGHSPHVVAQIQLAPGEFTELNLTLDPGTYLLRPRRLKKTTTVKVELPTAPTLGEVSIEEQGAAEKQLSLRPGSQLLSIRNSATIPVTVRIERVIPRSDVVTAAFAATRPRFKAWFPDEIVDANSLVTASQLSLLAASIADVDRIYSMFGDRQTLRVIDEKIQSLVAIIESNGGSLVRRNDDGLLAAFTDGTAAVKAAALGLTHRMDASETNLKWQFGVHRGPVLVTVFNGQQDYRGGAARVASSLATHAQPGELLLPESLATDLEVEQIIKANGLIRAGLAPRMTPMLEEVIHRLHQAAPSVRDSFEGEQRGV